MVNISKWDASEYLEDDDDVIAYLNAAAELNDPRLLQAAIGDIAKARGMKEIAQKAEVGRESLYKSLRRDGNPSFQTIVKVVQALGGRIAIEPANA
ncbi:addiction module antidote protein [Gardnerella piotii]|uniref:Addiction module antidote protein n=1 Tax=Gardnerella piotii TaxID=2792977 RepID=A0ABU5MPC7_9BIFI|nr:addiction module antidote protein [Gardnerella piotii]MDZ7544271.1 putative addiction module antidote protein [Gardnerella piotii]MDZ7552360.1 putative addiction module antidote protein [Gardnerella piotii]